ncbi:MAG: FAD/NAD(P)-binding oxidoreductase, partial [Archaeoglobaceae archaeon]
MKIAVLGGGVAGTLTANYLASRLREEIRKKEVQITLISEREKLLYEPGLLYLIFNRFEEKDILRDLKIILDPGVKTVFKRAEKIDLENRELNLGNEKLSYDYLVIATGSRIVPEEIPGLTATGHWFYNLDGAVRLRKEIARFKEGKVVVSVMGVPHKCPVAPIEVTFLLHDFFKIHGIRKSSEIVYTYPINRVFLMENVSELIQSLFMEKGIETRTFFNPIEVDAERKEIVTLEGEREKFDLLISIPPHKGAKVIIDSEISDDGWIPTDKYTLRVKGYDDTFAIGDATDLPVNKAGSVA